MDGPIDRALQATPGGTDAVLQLRSAVRARLAAAIDELATASAELAVAHEPASRLAAVIGEAARLQGELAEGRASEERRLGAWLAGGGGDPRPEPNPAIGAAAARLAALAGDAAAARTALPAAEQAFQRCAERVRDVQRRRDEAVCAAALDAARGFAEEYRIALGTAREREAALHGLRDQLLSRGNGGQEAPGALNAAGRIGELVAEVKRNAAVPHRPDPGRRLLAALATDPDAEL